MLTFDVFQDHSTSEHRALILVLVALISYNRKMHIWQSFVLIRKQRGCHGLEISDN